MVPNRLAIQQLPELSDLAEILILRASNCRRLTVLRTVFASDWLSCRLYVLPGIDCLADCILPGNDCLADCILPGIVCLADCILPGNDCLADCILPGIDCLVDCILPGNDCLADCTYIARE